MVIDVDIKTFFEKVPKPVFEISKVLKDAGYKSYLVGGSLRDILLGLSADDFDISTDATPEVLLKLFPKSLEVGAKFGTVIVLSSKEGLKDTTYEEDEYHVTTFRKDAKYIAGRWPESVEFSKTIEEDLSRRDFTINAIAIDIPALEEYLSESKDRDKSITLFLTDPFHGLKDIEDGIIRAVGDPYERMSEDGLRAMRACRLASKLDFRIEDQTFDAIKAASSTIDQISMERVRDEFLKVLLTETPSIGIELMRRTGLLQKFIPELLEGEGVEQNEYHVHDIYTHNLRTCDVAEKSIRLAALFHDIGKSRTKNEGHFYGHEEVGALMVKDILNRLKLPKAQIDETVKLVGLHMFYYQGEWSDSAVRRFLKKVGDDETLKKLFLLRVADTTANPKSEYDPSLIRELEGRIEKVRMEDNALSLKDLKINGDDIKELGINDGPKIGNILNELLEKVLDDPDLNDHDKLIKIAKELI